MWERIALAGNRQGRSGTAPVGDASPALDARGTGGVAWRAPAGDRPGSEGGIDS